MTQIKEINYCHQPNHTPCLVHSVTSMLRRSTRHFLHRQLRPIRVHPAKAYTVETLRVLFEIIEHIELPWHQKSCITRTKVIELLIQLCQHIPAVWRTEWIFRRSCNRKMFGRRPDSDMTGTRVGMAMTKEIGWLELVYGITKDQPYLYLRNLSPPYYCAPSCTWIPEWRAITPKKPMEIRQSKRSVK